MAVEPAAGLWAQRRLARFVHRSVRHPFGEPTKDQRTMRRCQHGRASRTNTNAPVKTVLAVDWNTVKAFG
ncbi:hypothetical protein [Streptomyces sp. NPDC050121]|uniref:hypothetical protein n=1 Tax=Streptomyces sp. NPDC050121 TaxID=3365601 RepID=UPI0037B6E896